MSFRINTNIAAKIAHRNLETSAGKMEASMGRLSTGLRINSAKDDPSGLIASENLRSQIIGIESAIRNNQDALNYAKTAETALGEVNKLLNDARSLAISSGNTATLSTSQLRANQDQLNSISSSITRIAQTVQFGAKKLLDGSAGVQAQVSAITHVNGISLGGTFRGDPVTATSLMTINSVTPGSQGTIVSSTLTGGVILNPGSFNINGTTFSLVAGTTGAQAATAINAMTGQTGVNANWNSTTNQITMTTTAYGSLATINYADASGVLSNMGPQSASGTNPSASVSLGSMGSALFTGGKAGSDGLSLYDADGNIVRLTSAGNDATDYPLTIGQVTSGISSFQFGGNAGQVAQLTLPNISASQLGNDVIATMSIANMDLTSTAGVTQALTIIDRAIDQVSGTRGTLGQFSSYIIESNSRHLEAAKANMTASESTIRDVDMAYEMTQYTTAQILQDAGMSILSQANTMPERVLDLLRG